MLIPPAAQKERVVAPEGLHTGVLYQIIDLGTHYSDMYDNTQRKVRFTWELSEELMDDGRPLSISKEYTLSANEKAALHKLIKGWTGENIADGFDLRTLLGRPGNVNVAHSTSEKGNVYAKVEGVTPLKRSETPPKQVNPPVIFDMTGGSVDTDVFNALPEFLKEKIMASPEYQQAVARANDLGPQNKRDAALGDDAPPLEAYSDVAY